MNSGSGSVTILCVDDEPGFTDLTATHLERFDDQFTTTTANDAQAALEFLHENRVDCIVSDYNMPGMDGLAFLQAVRTTDPELPFILYTGRGSEEIASDAVSAGVTDYMQKGGEDEQYTLLGKRIRNNVNRYRARREKQKAETRAETILDACPDAIVVSVNNEFVYANPKASDLYGVPDSSSLLGRNVGDFIHPDYRDDTDEQLQAVQSGGRSANHIPRTLLTIGGEEVPVEVTARHVSWDGEPGVVAIVRDITERKTPELPPLRYRALFEHANDAIALVEFQDGTPIIQEVNPAFESLFAPAEDVVGRDIDEVVAAGERVAEARDISQHTKEDELVRAELTRDTVDGPRDFLWQRIPLEDYQTGESETAFAMYTDITERKKREHDLERFQTAIEASGDPIYTLDESGHFTFANESLLELTGYDESTLLSEHASLVMEDDAVETGTEVIQSLLETDAQRDTFEFDLITNAGNRIRCENQVALLPFEDEFRGTVGVLRDITERVERERNLQRERDRLDEFTGIVAHDLRNPLSVASGRIDLLKEDGESEHIEDIEQAIDRMDDLLDGLLTLAREGREVSEIAPVALRDLLESCWRNVETTEATFEIQTEATIQADKSRLKQLVENLLRNAIEHGGTDTTIRVGTVENGLFIEDTGPGIPPDDRDEVFEPGFSTGQDGNGLGLSIVRQIAEAHDWEISVKEGSDGGARFEITGVEFSTA